MTKIREWTQCDAMVAEPVYGSRDPWGYSHRVGVEYRRCTMSATQLDGRCKMHSANKWWTMPDQRKSWAARAREVRTLSMLPIPWTDAVVLAAILAPGRI